jgi:hypothetical protein
MEHLQVILQVVIALGIANVWLVRAKRPTPYRGAGAQSMKEEFAAYGLSEGAMRVIGGFKLLFAAMLIVGIWVPALVLPAALGLGALMLGAVAMHVKIKDAAIRALPAFCMLCMSVGVVLLAR